MHPFQKRAWVNLGATLLFALSLPLLYLFTGGVELSFVLLLIWFGLSGIVHFISVRGKIESREWDEYHAEVGRRARDAGVLAFFFYCNLVFLFVTVYYFRESISFGVFQAFAAVGFAVFLGAHSISVLVVYRSDSTERLTLLDRWRALSILQHYGLGGLISIWIFPSLFWLAGREIENGKLPPEYLIGVEAGFFWLYLFTVIQMKKVAGTPEDLQRLPRAVKASFIAMLPAAVFVSGCLVLLAAKQDGLSAADILAGGFFLLLAAMLVQFIVLLLPLSRDSRAKSADTEETVGDEVTVYLNGDLKHNRKMIWAWAFQFVFGLFIISWNLPYSRGEDSASSGLLNLIMGAMYSFIGLLSFLFRRKMILFVTLGKDKISARTSMFGGIQSVAWRDLARIELKFTEALLVPADPGGRTVKLKLGSFESNRRIKSLVRAAGVARGVEVIG